jgi:hypothetical protein
VGGVKKGFQSIRDSFAASPKAKKNFDTFQKIVVDHFGSE